MRCAFCDRPASRRCDAVLGWSVQLDQTGATPRMVRDEAYTCDLAVCHVHVVRAGTIFLSGREGGVESTDRCPHHGDRSPEQVEQGKVLLTDRGAAALRAELARKATPALRLVEAETGAPDVVSRADRMWAGMGRPPAGRSRT